MYKSFGERMKSRRTQLKLTLRELGKKTDVSASFLSDIENGNTSPSMERAYAISTALEVPLSWLLGEDKNEEADSNLINDISKDGIMYELFLDKHVFPNGLTYKEMCDKINLLNKVQRLLITNEIKEE